MNGVPTPIITTAADLPDRSHLVTAPAGRIYYRKEKLRGACWEYEIDGGWITVPTPSGVRSILHHRFSFYRPREMEVRTCRGRKILARTGAEQWFFPDRWFSLLRFTT